MPSLASSALLAALCLYVTEGRASCTPQGKGISHHTSNPDTANAFLKDAYYSSHAKDAHVPSGYSLVFRNTHGSAQADDYRGYTALDTYDVQTCADKCNAMKGCTSFNIYYERDPSTNPDSPACQDPSSITNIKCAWWGSQIQSDDDTNTGQYRGSFQVVIAGSNAYNLDHAKSPTPAPKPSPSPSPSNQNLVTFDAKSLFVRGQRVAWFSGSFHPYRLPVPGLWRDILEKIRALGYNGVTFYINWALVEGEEGVYRADGIFDLKPFFEAAKEVGIWLNARPGPYINAESSGGGFPGWQQTKQNTLRTDDESYLDTTTLYMSKVGALLAEYQIVNGGPIVLVQPENEYSQGPNFPEPEYFGYVEQQLRDAGIVVPLMNNQAYADGYYAPGQIDAADIYGYDSYPLGFDCADPSNWNTNSLATNLAMVHAQQSPTTPHSIVEFQGGSFDPWGGVGYAKCAELLNHQFESVFYKNNIGQGVKMLNLYMTYGGTNWGNLGYATGYTSYDYGAAISEDRGVTRQKYSEAKLIANSIRASPAFLAAVADFTHDGTGVYASSNHVQVSVVSSNTTQFFVIRNSQYYSTDAIAYLLKLPTSKGNITVPQLGGVLGLEGRESKIVVTDFDVGGITLLYSSADVFTWQKIGSQRTLVLYGGIGQTHEFAVVNAGLGSFVQGNGTIKNGAGIGSNSSANGNGAINGQNTMTVVNLQVSSTRHIIQFQEGLAVHVVDRSTAYNYWVISPDGFEHSDLPIVYMDSGYLVRDAKISGSLIHVTGDLNATSSVEAIGVPDSVSSISFNGQTLAASRDLKTGILTGTVQYHVPQLSLPDLSQIGWKYIDGLPEIQNSYDDSKWTTGNLTYTNNTVRGLNTPTSLYAADYGYNTGSLIYRGHFVSNGTETQLQLSPQGGYGFGYTLWLNETYIGNWVGTGRDYYYYGYFNLPSLTAGENYVFTVLMDYMGNEEDFQVGSDSMKQPRGVMQYTLATRSMDAITWKLTGNLGGTHYHDKTRGPLNEGGMYAERQGFYLPDAPTSSWADNSPITGISKAGVAFYTTEFNLDLPKGYDIPVSIDFGPAAINANAALPCRVVMYVNGYQYGKYVNTIGPQTSFPVPEGIWNYQGKNTLAIELWAVGSGGASLPGLSLKAGFPIESGYGSIAPAPQSGWTLRKDAY